ARRLARDVVGRPDTVLCVPVDLRRRCRIDTWRQSHPANRRLIRQGPWHPQRPRAVATGFLRNLLAADDLALWSILLACLFRRRELAIGDHLRAHATDADERCQ